jgi:hypothetical protein
MGRKGSSQYVYWKELREAYSEGYSLLVYQHFPQFVKRSAFIKEKGLGLQKECGAETVGALITPHVVFYLAVQPRHISFLVERAKIVQAIWGNEIHYVCL